MYQQTFFLQNFAPHPLPFEKFLTPRLIARPMLMRCSYTYFLKRVELSEVWYYAGPIPSVGQTSTVNVLYLACTIFGGLPIFCYLAWI